MNKFSRLLPHRLTFMVIGIVLLQFSASAQQGHVYNQFFMNPYIYNPAYAGVDGHGVVFAMYKQQWSNIPDGPKLSHATYHVPMKGGIGFGVAAFQDTQGPLTTSAGKVSGSYLVNIDRKHFLRLGMSLGMGSHQIVLPEDAIGDNAFAGSGSNYLIGDFGATYHFDHFNIGFSLPNLFVSELIPEDGGFSKFEVKPTDRMLFKMNYRGHINHEFAIEPHILYRYSAVLPDQFEIATVVHVKHIAWVGATYRQDAGMVGLLGFKLKKKFAVGAAFELGNPDISSQTGSTFEIHIGMHMGSHHKEKGGHKKSHVDHHKSWFLTHSDEHLAKAAAKRRRDSLLALQNNPTPVVIDDTPSTPDEEIGSWDLDNDFVTRTNAAGEIQSGQMMERAFSDGTKEFIVGFPPARNGGSAWAMAPGVQKLEERTSADGTKEIGVKWVRLGADGALESKIVWEPVMDESEAAALLDGGSIDETPTSDPVEEPLDDPVETPVQTPIETPVVPVVTQPSDQELEGTNEHHEVTRGGSPVEFPPGIYIVAGSFKTLQQAEDFSQRMFHRGYKKGNKVGRINGRDNWYVILEDHGSLSAAKQARDRIRQSIKGAWVLKVN